MPRLLNDIVHTILAAEADLDVDAPSSHAALLPEKVRDADVVIVMERELAGMNYESLLRAHPRLRLVALSGDGRSGALCELRPCRVPLGELSPQSLIDAVRAQPGYWSTS
jgi:hypothetical protein